MCDTLNEWSRRSCTRPHACLTVALTVALLLVSAAQAQDAKKPASGELIPIPITHEWNLITRTIKGRPDHRRVAQAVRLRDPPVRQEPPRRPRRASALQSRAKRRLVAHPKFYYFDAGVYQAIRPRGPLDPPEQIHGAALETLFLQQARAYNDYHDLGYRLHYWHTASGDEVDFVLYGERGLRAFEVKMTQRVRSDDLRALLRFRADFPQAKTHLLYLGNRRWHDRGVEVVPFVDCVTNLDSWL